MRVIPVALSIFLAASALAGCLGTGDGNGSQSLEPTSGNGNSGATGGASNGGRQATGAQARAQLEWPSIEEAKVRPGVQVVSPGGQCTSNFVFFDAGANVYLGLAAHCVDGMKVGDAVKIDGGTATGTLAYSSWITMDEVKEKDETIKAYNDFALIRVDDAHKGLVHPAVRHFGGPVALANAADAGVGSKVLTYGNSGLRLQVEEASPHEGYVIERSNAWTTTVYTATPGVPGDSGSAVLTGDGKALGVLVTLTIAPLAGSNGVTSLDAALAYAREKAGVDVQLATWELIDAGLLPGA